MWFGQDHWSESDHESVGSRASQHIVICHDDPTLKTTSTFYVFLSDPPCCARWPIKVLLDKTLAFKLPGPGSDSPGFIRNVTAYNHLRPRLRHTTCHLDWEIGVAWYRVLLLFCMKEGNLLITEKTYDMYLRITRSPTAMRQRTLKSEILSTKSELLKTSAQDQFAKWAKLRRSVDKGLADLEKLSEFASSNFSRPKKNKNDGWMLILSTTFLCRRRSSIFQICFRFEIQYTIMALDHRIAVRRRMVVQEAACVFSSSRMVWPAWMVACVTICPCRYVFFFPLLVLIFLSERCISCNITLPCGPHLPTHLPWTQSSWHYHPSYLFLLFFFFWKKVIRDWCLCEHFAGSVSVGVWQIACRRLIVVGEKTVKSFAGK